MGGLYHGRILLHWCDHCHVPVLGEQCACGNNTRSVPVTPPGDARPAFPEDISFVNSLYEEEFGLTLIPDGHIALLNKVPDSDRMEEIIVGGAVVGSVRYLPDERRWEALPRPEAACIAMPEKKFIEIDEGAAPSVSQGSSLLAPGLIHCEKSVRAGDEVFMITGSGKCAGTGRARVDAEEANRMERGQVVKTRKNIRSEYLGGKASWEDVISANQEILARTEAASGKFINDNIGKFEGLKICVSYSGGKDSLATLLVVMNTYKKTPIMYIDTGLEFPSTEENIKEVTSGYDLECIRIESGEEFWREYETAGPPAVDNRWCCKTAKLEPLRQFIEKNWGECVSFVGQRKYESFSRMKNPRIWRNSFVRNQICLAPIHNWTALHVWLYIFQNHAPYNSMYEHGVDRMGCYICPASDLAVLERIKIVHPDLWEKWMNKLIEWQINNKLPESWVFNGEWRKKGDKPA